MVEPGGQRYPAGHSPLHSGAPRAKEPPQVPAGQGVHGAAPPVPKVPAVHRVPVAFILPGGQAYPAGLLQFRQLVRPTPPKLYLPAGHRVPDGAVDSAKHAVPGFATQMLVHDEVFRPKVAPYLLGGHGAHSCDPPIEYLPGLHGVPVGL